MNSETVRACDVRPGDTLLLGMVPFQVERVIGDWEHCGHVVIAGSAIGVYTQQEFGGNDPLVRVLKGDT